MPEQPIFPIILSGKSNGTLDLFEDAEGLNLTTAWGLITESHKDFYVYDRHSVWEIAKVISSYKINAFTKLLAYTIYNPTIVVTVTWTKKEKYNLDDLKKDICNKVDQDDDIITQFSEAGIIKQEIENCNSFDEIIRTLNKYVFDVNEEELMKE